MLYCIGCKVSIAGKHIHCPLCGGKMTGEAAENSSYPQVFPDRSWPKKVIQLISASALSAAVICVAINILIPTETFWALFAVFGLACGWLWSVVGIIKKSKLINNIAWQVIMISVPAFLLDWFTGWYGWSVDYVFPCVCSGAMLAIIILSRVMHMPAKEYIINLIVCTAMGIIPLVWLFTGVLRIIIPSVICAAVSLIIIFIQLIFNWKAICREILKKFHL